MKRTVEWARRRPAVAALLVVGALAAAALDLAGGWQLVRVQEQNARLIEEHGRARAQSRRAHDNLREALAVIERMVTLVARDDLAEVPQLEQLRRRVLEEALAFHEQFRRKNEGMPDMEEPVASSLVEVGDIYRRLGRLREADRALGQARQLLEGIVLERPHAKLPQELLVRALYTLGLVRMESGKLDEAQGLLGVALAGSTKLRRDFPDDHRFTLDQSQVHSSRGNLLLRGGNLAEARDEFARALEILQEAPADERDALAFARARAAARDSLRNVLRQLGETEAADALEREGQSVEAPPTHAQE